MYDYTRKFVRGLIVLTLLLGCGDDDGGADSGTDVDANGFDAASEFDAQPDTSSLDSSTTDVPASDAGADAAAVDGSAADGSTGDSGANDAGMDAGPEDPRCPSVDSVPEGERYTTQSHRFGDDPAWDFLVQDNWPDSGGIGSDARWVAQFTTVAVALRSTINRIVADFDDVFVYGGCGGGDRLLSGDGTDILEPGQYLVIVIEDSYALGNGLTSWSIYAPPPPPVLSPNHDRATAIEWMPDVPLEWSPHASRGPYYYWVECQGDPIFHVGPWDERAPSSVIDMQFVDAMGVAERAFSPETPAWYDEGVRVDYRTFSGCGDTERQLVRLYRSNGGSYTLSYR